MSGPLNASPGDNDDPNAVLQSVPAVGYSLVGAFSLLFLVAIGRTFSLTHCRNCKSKFSSKTGFLIVLSIFAALKVIQCTFFMIPQDTRWEELTIDASAVCLLFTMILFLAVSGVKALA